MDNSSPLLMTACAAGTHIDSINIELCRAGTEKIKFMAYRLTDSLISSVLVVTGDPKVSFPMEMVKISYGKIEWCYTQQKRQGGGPAGNVACGWNLEHNCQI